MNKRSAMMVAAGLVLAMLVAGMAVAAGFTGPEASAGGSRATTDEIQRREPKVRTITETVTVHRKAEASDQGTLSPVVVTQTPSAPASTSSSSDDFGDDEYEDEYEGQDHEDDHGDEYEYEDHEGEDD
jgi:hypothetical protein